MSFFAPEDQILGLTLWRPWTDAILRLPDAVAKRVENRDWTPNPLGAWDCGEATLKGSALWLALHAGLTLDKPALAWLFEKYLAPLSLSRELLPAGHIVGVARVSSVIDTQRLSPHSSLRKTHAPWLKGRFGWVLSDVHRLPEPVPCTGQVKLWSLPPSVKGRVLAQLPRSLKEKSA